MVEISVVVPVYNVEEFLGECLDSIVNQTFKDIEIICVNDGSPDNSLEILKEYAARDDRFIVIDQENGGHAVASNRGIDIAKGKYLFLMDSDDILDLNAFEHTYKVAEERNVDFVIFQAINYYMDKNELVEAENYSMNALADFVGDRVFNWREVKDFAFKITVTPWSKLYNREFIMKNNIRFPEGYVFDDNVFFFDVFFAAERMTFLREHLFKRRWYSSSSTTSGGVKFMDYIPICGLIWDVFTKYGVFEEFKEKLFDKKIGTIHHWYKGIKEEFKQEYFDRMKADYVELADDEEFFEDFINSLTDHQKMVFDSVLESEVYTEFDLKLQQKKLIHRNNELKAAVLEEQRKNGQFRKKRYGTKNKIESLKAENEKMILANEQLTNKINNLS
ncbi:glycosyltransferase family 2 protein [Methanobrevibacter sp.]|uniref:glycosyltransferase family 2 protein n=1 Tax=Methanobrevibacter sp. TaxID=66852 RepID=UPI0038647B98